MKIPLSWLSELADLPDSPHELTRQLTEAGLECELSGERSFPERVVTGKIVSCEKHPNADRLSVCEVDVGDGELHQIICGAPNAKAGPVAVAALPGAELGEGFVIAKRKLRGVESHGMLCSESELGISEASEGILLLPEDTPLGRPLSEILPSTPMLVTEPTSNRGDCMAVEGVAREVAAIQGKEFRRVSPEVADVASSAGYSVSIDDPTDCARYCGRVIQGVAPGPSPDWMAERLTAVGIRPLMNLIDVTNYVLLELGHPLHAFDLDKLTGKTIGVRRARSGETLVTLDGKHRELSTDTLLITDEGGPVALGGIMGGESTMVSESTNSVFLEGASFHAARVRAGVRHLKLITDASARFERDVDPAGLDRALDRAVELLLAMCPGAELVGKVDEYPAPTHARQISLRPRTLERTLGRRFEADEVSRLLEGLEIQMLSHQDDEFVLECPTFRGDLAHEEDLVEEVGRLYGYDALPERPLTNTVTTEVRSPRTEAQSRSRSILLSLGLTEVITPSLIKGKKEQGILENDELFLSSVPLRNPLTSDRDALRGSLSYSLLEVLASNVSRSTRDVAIFELGRVFGGSVETEVVERLHGAILLAGNGVRASDPMYGSPCDFFDMKGFLEVYVERFFGGPVRLGTSATAPLDSLHSAEFFLADRRLGVLGELGSVARKKLDLPPDLPVFLAEWELEESPENRRIEYEALPRFPGVLRDLAFVVSRGIRQDEVEAAIRHAGGELLEQVSLFDVYEGEQLSETEKSLAYNITFRSRERSLTNDEVDRKIDAIVKHVGSSLNGKIR